MWDETKQQRLDTLRRRADEGTLSAEEQRLLDTLLLELEQAEWEAIRPALSRLRAEQADLQAGIGRLQIQNATLNVLAERYSDLLTRTRAQLSGLARERDALRQAYEHAIQDAVQS